MKKMISIIVFVLVLLIVFPSCKGKKSNSDNNNIKQNVGEYTDVYDEDGLVKEKIFYDDNNSQSSKIQYEYDDNGNMTSEKKVLSDGSFDSMTKYEYKKFGDEYKEVKKTVYISENKISKYYDNYEYKKFGLGEYEQYCVISFTQHDTEDGSVTKFVYSYDEDGTLKALKTYDEKGNTLTENKF